jgi:hypothetical protein
MDSFYKNETYIYNLLLDNDLEFKNDNKEYEKYLTLLDYYYKTENKKDKYKKDFKENELILVDKKDSRKIIRINSTIFINVNNLYLSLKKYIDDILLKISLLVDKKTNINDDNRIEFEELKKKYILFKKTIKEIDNINKNFYESINKLIDEKIDKTYKLDKYYQKRILEYSKIEVMITEKLKNELLVIFKKNNKKIPNDSVIKSISKNNNIPTNEIEKWFEWIETTYLYILSKNEVNNIEEEIKEKENKYNINMENMIIKKPEIKE